MWFRRVVLQLTSYVRWRRENGAEKKKRVGSSMVTLSEPLGQKSHKVTHVHKKDQHLHPPDKWHYISWNL